MSSPGRGRALLFAAPLASAALAGCRGRQSMLDPAGPHAAHVADLWWLMTGVLGAIYLLVLLALAYALFHRGERHGGLPPESPREHRAARVVTVAVGATVVVLFGLLVASIVTGRATASLATDQALVVDVTGNQWWWRIDYRDAEPSRNLTTANELHLPVGRPVMLRLRSNDVVHSLWIPNLAPKKDLVPGYSTSNWVIAERAGVYRGQCAEFCGMQHAHMALWVVAESPDDFARWFESQLRPAAAPAEPLERRGQELLVGTACALCHTVRGTDAGGKTGPDLTHLASRRSLAAATLPNTKGHLAAWLADPQGIKPGNRMPAVELTGPDLQALIAYLESLH